MTENHLGNVDTLLLVHLDGDTATIVAHRDLALFAINPDLDLVHVLVALLVVGSVDEDFVENLVQTRYVADVAALDGFALGVVDPHLFLEAFDGANVCVRTLDDVLQLGELLVL